jgi:hypothetical protein
MPIAASKPRRSKSTSARTAHLLIDHFDGLGSFDDLPGDGRCVRDLWF